MGINFSLINVIALFGALQGFLLCWVLYKKRTTNIQGAKFLILFIFSLSFLNLNYVLMYMNVLELYKPLYIFPFPYKYILGPAFFLYVSRCVGQLTNESIKKRQSLLFIPALIYGLMLLFWFSIAVRENSYRIVAKLVVSDFFRANELVFLIFTSVVLIYALRILVKAKAESNHIKHIHWLRTFLIVFLCAVIINFTLNVVDLTINGDDTRPFNYPNLVINSVFIYWIGYVGLLKPNLLLPRIKQRQESGRIANGDLEKKLFDAMQVQELFKNKDLTLPELALSLGVSSKDISIYINETLGMNFSEYLNRLRVENVKARIATPDADKFTLLALAEEAGFSSKSTFYATFKRIVGLTPSDYKKSLPGS